MGSRERAGAESIVPGTAGACGRTGRVPLRFCRQDGETGYSTDPGSPVKTTRASTSPSTRIVRSMPQDIERPLQMT